MRQHDGGTRTAARSRRAFGAWSTLIVGAILILAIAAGWWWLRARRVEWAIDRGIAAIGNIQRPVDTESVLRQWEAETGPFWQGRERTLLRRLVARGVDQVQVRQLVGWLSGADYGDRAEDWRRWQDSVLKGKRRRGSTSIALHPLWQARVGTTAWFSTILPIDGQIYVASLGQRYDDPRDPSDGVIRVDGRTGLSEYIFESPDAAPGDVVGLAAGGGRLYVACRNGMVYGISPSGTMEWRSPAGGRIHSTPMVFESSRGGPLCVAVATESGRIIAINTANGRPHWVAQMPAATSAVLDEAARAALPRPLLGFSLSFGNFTHEPGGEVMVVNLAGEMRAFNAANGRQRWQAALPSGNVGGVVHTGVREGAGVGVVADLHGGLWMLARSERRLAAAALPRVLARSGSGVTAGVRTVGGRGFGAVLACTSGGSGAERAVISNIGVGAVQWRSPVRGRVWAPPAVADLNGDREPEFIFTSTSVEPDGSLVGWLTIVSTSGHILREERGPAPFECAPVVADVDGDGRNELLVADTAGILHCFATERSGPIEWGVAGGDLYNSRNASMAYSFGQSPYGFQWQWRPE